MRRSVPIVFAAILAASPTATTAVAEEVESPTYRSWARHKVGTTVKLRSVTASQGREIETTTTYRLLEVTDKMVVVEMVVVSNATGERTKHAAQKVSHKRMFPLLTGVKKEDVGKPRGVVDQGEETVAAAGREYRALWYDEKGRTEAGASMSRTWMSDEVPGRLLKSVTKVPAAQKTTTLELVEFTTP